LKPDSVVLEEEFVAFLGQKADTFGFREPKRSEWINYMADKERGQSTVSGVLEQLGMKPCCDDAALDLGCGFGNLVISLNLSFGRVCGMDIVEERARWCAARAPGAHVICGDATAVPWSAESFDLITSTDVFEHLSYDAQRSAAREIARVLRTGGHAFITVPSRFQLIDEHNRVWFGTWLPHRLRRYYSQIMQKQYLRCWERTGRGWARLFRQAGLATKVSSVTGRSRWFPSRFELYLTKQT
jgi:SAM-dependent methyltransferase